MSQETVVGIGMLHTFYFCHRVFARLLIQLRGKTATVAVFPRITIYV